jgi:DNA primase
MMPKGKTELLWSDLGPKGDTTHYELPAAATFDMWQEQPIPDYVVNRGIDQAHWDDWGMGYDSVKRRWIFVCRDREQKIVGYTGRLVWEREHCFGCGRSIVDQERTAKRGKTVLMRKCERCHRSFVKYWNFPGTWRRQSLYGIHRYTGGSVVVVEGSTDCSRLNQLGVRNPLGLFGANINPEQADLLFSLDCRIVVCGDGDKAGRKLNDALRSRAVRSDRDCEVVELPDELDPGALTETQAHSLMPSHVFR